MAVSFKVPSSPKKSVFEIDNFLGVDLTNTGSNIDEVRSPNAENMVRYVPGKVRKRTGYKTQIEFSSGTDVNRAKDTSDEWKEIDVTATTFEDANLICEFYDIFPQGTKFFTCMEIEAVGSYRISEKPSTYGWNIVGTVDEPYSMSCYRFNGSSATGDANGIYVHKTSEGSASDYFRIKNIRVYWKTSASSSDDLIKLEWNPAPEELGITFIKTDSDMPINGVHRLETGEVNGNRIIDVNRMPTAWSHSDTWYTISSSNWGRLLDSIPGTQKIYFQFEYKDIVLSQDSSAAYFVFGDEQYEIVGTEGIFSQTVTVPDGENEIEFRFAGFDSLKYKSMLATYEKSGEFAEWHPSPESESKEFYVNDMYIVDGENISEASSDSHEWEETSSSSASRRFLIQAITNPQCGGLWNVSFDSSISAIENSNVTGNENIFLYAVITNKDDYLDVKYVVIKQLKNHSNKTISAYVSCPSDYFVSSIAITISYPSQTNFTASSYIKNIRLQRASIKSDYDNVAFANLYHVGDSIYIQEGDDGEVIKLPNTMNNHRSNSWQIGNCVYILDGSKYIRYNGTTSEIENVEDVGYIPTVTVAKEPSGGGVSNEPFNMLQPGFIELFAGNGSSTTFNLSLDKLDSTIPKVWIMDESGTFVECVYHTDFEYSPYIGRVTFTEAPSESPITGEDNVKILAYKTITDYADRINKCTIGTLFGVNGASDRLFISGNPDHKNWDFFSEQYDPTYFPDTGYSQLGLETSAIVGYSKVNNYLATHKDDRETEQNVLVREGDLITRTVEYAEQKFEFSDPAFKLINTIQGAGAIGKYTFGNLQTEPVFLTKSGIYAITPQDLTGEKYGQNRSFYLNGKLLKEENLSDAYATVYNDMYVLSVNDKLYILDGLQSIQTDKSAPYATRQYVGYYCTDVPANIIFTQDDALWIGTHDGKICRFATDIEALDSYNDDGKPIYCCWETPDLDGRLFYKNKTFRYFAIRMMQALKTSVKLYSEKLGAWTFIKEDTSSGIVFDFENIDFELFSFSTDTSEKVVHTKMRVKKVDKARFRVENSNINEPFGLFNLALEYVESGNYKG